MISYRLEDDTLLGTPAPPLLSERRAADYLGLSLDALRHEVNIGALKFLGTRAKKKFLQPVLDEWRRQHPPKRKGASPKTQERRAAADRAASLADSPR
jgi:hypothetical protein